MSQMSAPDIQANTAASVGSGAEFQFFGERVRGEKFRSISVIMWYILFFEYIAVAVSTYSASILYHFISFGTFPPSYKYIIASVFISLFFILISAGSRQFLLAETQQRASFVWSGFTTSSLSFALFLTAIFLLKASVEYSRGAFIFENVSVTAVVCTLRAFVVVWLRKAVASGRIETRRAILIGRPDQCRSTAQALAGTGVRVVAICPLPAEACVNAAHVEGEHAAVSSSERALAEACRGALPDDIIIIADSEQLFGASDLARFLSSLPCDVHLAPIEKIRFLTHSQTGAVGALKTLHVSRRPLSVCERAFKRALDLAVAGIGLVVLSPLLLIIGIIVKLESPGRVLFRQERHGYNNKVIRVYKFRSMVETDEKTFVPTAERDVRVTRFGRILRRTNLDEVPQLLNVIRGEMSIVGPRPHAISHNKLFEEYIWPFARRHNVKPGITGWAQVNGLRGPANTVDRMRERVMHDLYYIDNWSLLLDLKIIVMTVFSRKAYRNAF